MKKGALLSLISALFFLQGFAQIVDPFSIRYQNQQKGGIVMLANVSVSCTNCTTTIAQVPPNGNGVNNSFTMSYVDIDGNASTFMSSSDSLNLSSCSEILWAGLYWSARVGTGGSVTATTNYNQRNQVKLKVGNGTYQTLTADELLDNSTGHQTYHCYKNITSIVQGNGIKARYTVADLVTRTGTSAVYGGWTIVVVYKNVYESMRNLTVFDGLANVSTGNSVTIPISGFVTPLAGPVNFELGVVSHDGDRGDVGDQLLFNGAGSYVNVSDALHNSNDIFNSTIANNAVLTPFRDPSLNNTLGHDASVFKPVNTTMNYIGNNATSANIQITTGQETILTSVVTSVIDVFEPDLRATVYISDINGGQVNPGDQLEYTVVGKNIGSDISVNTFITDTLDPRTVYIPGSISISYGQNMGPKTDAYSDDQAEYDPVNKVIIARIGTGANGSTGGTVANSPTGADSTVLKFRVTVINDCLMFQCDQTLEHKAYIFGTGHISGNQYNNSGLSDLYDANGCPTIASNSLSINVASCPPPTITTNSPLCVGATIQLSVPYSASAHYAWTGPNGFTSTIHNPSISNVTVANQGTYNVTITFDGLDCVLNASATVIVNSLPTIQQNSLTNVNCFNGNTGAVSITASGNGAFTYAWSNGNSTSHPTGLAAGSYTVTVTDANTCTATQTFTITQNPQITGMVSATTSFQGYNISCFGGANGAASVSASGGTPGYTYLWNNGSTNVSASNLSAGTASVTVTDNLGCTRVLSAVLTQPTQLQTTMTGTNVLCFGNNTGSIASITSGGVAPYAYSWAGGTSSLSNLPVGTYNLTVTDQNGCTTQNSTTITGPAASLSLVHSLTQVPCFGTSTGAIDITPSGGTLPYTYAWSNGAATQDLAIIAAGNYSLTITDANNCQLSQSFTITQPATAISATSTITPVLCFGATTGAIDITPSGGTGAYTYTWSNGTATQDLANMPGGNYSVIIKDQNNCTFTLSNLDISQPAAALQTLLQPTDVGCFGASSGAIVQTTTGGTIPYTFSWNSGETTQNLASIPQGTYTVKLTDANGCTTSATTTISQPPMGIQLSEVHVDVLCYNEATGAIDVTTSGGTAPYTFSWSDGQTTEDLTSVQSGSYTLTVTDHSGCTETITAIVSQPAQALTPAETHTDALCIGGQQGTIDLSVSGGTAPYTYLWNNTSSNEDQTGLLAGNYNALVTDAHNCQASISVEILDPSNTTVLSETHTDVACFGQSTGSVDLQVTGGVAPHSYAWTNGETTQDIAGLPAGNYAVNVLDFNGCGEFISVLINEPATAVTASITHTDVLCHGFNTGSMEVSASGGVAPYTYAWSNGETTALISNLVQGTYTVIVTDDHGCDFSISETITQPDPIVITETITDVNCFGDPSGNIQIAVSGGFPAYSFSWSNGAASQSVTALTAGSYALTVTDQNNCTAQETYTIDQPVAPLTTSSTISAVSCFGTADGSIDFSVTGGTTPYAFAWSNGQTTANLSGLTAGTYSVIVTDYKGCTSTSSLNVTQPSAPLTVGMSMTPVVCYGESNGTATAAATGGTVPYSYTWNTGSTNTSAGNLSAGNYSVTVTDFNNCQATASIAVTEPAALAIQLSATDVLCYGQPTGSASVAAIGGQGTYTYTWTNGTSTPTISNLAAGTYGITVMDANNCSYTSSIAVNQPQAPLDFIFTKVDNICFGGTSGSATVTISGGTAPYVNSWSNSATSLTINNLSAGFYTFNTVDANNCVLSESVMIAQPGQISMADSARTHVSCNGLSDGAIQFSTAGGTPSYSYLWSTGATTEDVSSLSAGTYSVLITDANSCQRTFGFVITQPDVLQASYTTHEPSCFGYNDGEIFSTVSGGTMPYTYAWSNGATTANNTNAAAGNHDLTITDLNGCILVLNATLTQPAQIQVSFDANKLTGCDPLKVRLTNTSDEQFQSSWNFGDGTTGSGTQVEHLFTGEGCYDINLEVTDANGCSNNVTYAGFICVLETPVASIGVSNLNLAVYDPETIITNLSAHADSYSWNLGGTNDYDYFEPGTHTFPAYNADQFLVTLIAYNDNGCVDSTAVLIHFDNDLIMYVPNTFTPNGDEMNQVFMPVFPTAPAVYNLKIYNRWGEMVFESSDTNIGWDGTYNGVMVQDGVYTWDIFVNTFDAHLYKKQGFVAVLK